jgi:phosphomannomutase
MAIHNFRDPYFGGYGPEISENNLAELKSFVAEKKCDLGIATDVDADRFAIINELGEYVSCNNILALLFEYLAGQGFVKNSIGRSISTTHMLDRIADIFSMRVAETPVGFKYLAQQLKKNEIEIACEENGGFSLKNHVPEKDGILAGLLTAEVVAAKRTPLSVLIQNMHKAYGPLFYERRNFPITYKLRNRVEKVLKNPPDKIAGRKVVKVNTIDGLKLYLDGNEWILIRLSGTEPAVRIYIESENRESINELLNKTKSLLKLE